MSSNLQAAYLPPSAFIPEAAGYPLAGTAAPYGLIPVGLFRGIGLEKIGNSATIGDAAVQATFQVPYNTTFATGLTVSLLLAEDAEYSDPGANAYIGVTIGPITSGTSTLDESTAGSIHGSTEVLSAITLPATTGVVVLTTFLLPNADLNSLAAGSWATIRVRRLGTNTSDTHTGRVVLLGVNVRDT